MYSFKWCLACGRGTKHSKQGCCACRAKDRRLKRIAKGSNLGNPLVRLGDVMRVADDLTSVYVRACTNRCAMCLEPRDPWQLQWAHHFSRSMRHLRYRADNASALCGACHRRNTPSDRPEFRDWLRDVRLGHTTFDHLECLARTRGRMRLSDYQLVIIEANVNIGRLPPGPRRDWAFERQDKINARLASFGR